MTTDPGAEEPLEDGGLDMFQEPDGFYQAAPEATFAKHQMLSGEELTLRLVGSNPLWGHHLWNAGRVTAAYLEEHAARLTRNRSLLEFGAGAGLPSLVGALLGAAPVVVTDYPDPDLLANLTHNRDVHRSCLPDRGGAADYHVEGYIWGQPADPLLAHLAPGPRDGFDTLILADLLFNHTEHAKLLASLRATLRRHPDARALVFFTPHRPWLLQEDLAFLDRCRETGDLVVEKVCERLMPRPMFEEDRGDEVLRRTVFGFEVRWLL